MSGKLEPGYYEDEQGNKKYWDGSQWLKPVQADAPAESQATPAASDKYLPNSVARDTAIQNSQSLVNSKKGLGCGGWTLIVIGLIFAIVVIATIAGGTSGSSTNSSGGAIYFCENRIKMFLKAPSTASFHSSASGTGNVWTVTGTVDAENSFGAKIQNSYQCTVTINGDEGVTTVDYLN